MNVVLKNNHSEFPFQFAWRVGPYFCLCKFKIALFASLSTLTGFCLAPRGLLDLAPSLLAGLFLIACGACALNHWQERDIDARMPRTAGRPLPTGRIRPGNALLFAACLILSGSILLSLTGPTGPAAPLLALGAVAWYNGVYTPLKRFSAFAAIPGALVGAIPPAIGWLAGGGGITDTSLLALCFFFFMWQVPHFFIHLLSFRNEYEHAGLPSLTAVLTETQLRRLTFTWTAATAVSLQVAILFSAVRSPLIRMSLLSVSLGLVGIGISFVRAHHPGYGRMFRQMNYFIAIVAFIILLDRLLSLSL